MTDKKLTTESIVQGLDGADVFLRDLAGSTHTSLNEYDIGILFNIAHLCGDAADFINRQKVEIKRSQKENKQFAYIGKMYSEIKSEAIQEFAERLKEALYRTEFGTPVVDVEDIDNLVKGMVGDTG